MNPRYALVENILPLDTCKLVSLEMFRLKNRGIVNSGDSQVPTATTYDHLEYTSFLFVLLPIIKTRLEEFWDKKLIPTYVYSRLLYPGSFLLPHTDRESCEYSVSITLDHNYPKGFEYPIYMENTPINIPIGSGATYLGCEVEHWREPLIGTPENFWAQAFFHYVDADGIYADFAWDKFEHLTKHMCSDIM